MACNIKLLIASLLFLLALPLCTAIGIGLRSYNAYFEPGFNKNYEGIVFNNVGQPIRVHLMTKGTLGQYVTFGEDFMDIPIGGQSYFTFNIKLPEEISSGENIIYIGVEEVESSGGGGMFSVKTAAYWPFTIHSSYPGKYLEASLTATDVQENNPVNFTVYVTSKGEEMVTLVDGIIEIYDSSEKIDVVSTDKIENMLPKDEKTLTSQWESRPHPTGEYGAKLKLIYDGSLLEKNASFTVLEYLAVEPKKLY